MARCSMVSATVQGRVALCDVQLMRGRRCRIAAVGGGGAEHQQQQQHAEDELPQLPHAALAGAGWAPPSHGAVAHASTAARSAKYRRIMLKVSGEALQVSGGLGL